MSYIYKVCNKKQSQGPIFETTILSAISFCHTNEPAEKKTILKIMFKYFDDDNSDNSGKYVNGFAVCV